MRSTPSARTEFASPASPTAPAPASGVWDRPSPVVLAPANSAGEDCEASEVALAGSLLGWVCGGETLSTTYRTLFLARVAPGSRPSAFVDRRAGAYAGSPSDGGSIVFNTTGLRLWRLSVAASPAGTDRQAHAGSRERRRPDRRMGAGQSLPVLDRTGGRQPAPSPPRAGERGVRLTPSEVVLLRNGELRVYSRSGRLIRAWGLRPTYEEPRLLDADGEFAVVRQSPAGDWRGQIRLVRLRDGRSRVLALPAGSTRSLRCGHRADRSLLRARRSLRRWVPVPHRLRFEGRAGRRLRSELNTR